MYLQELRSNKSRMLTAPQNQSGHFRSKKNQFIMSGIEAIFLEHLAHSLVNITTTLTGLQHLKYLYLA
jgi:hypothetical protein